MLGRCAGELPLAAELPRAALAARVLWSHMHEWAWGHSCVALVHAFEQFNSSAYFSRSCTAWTSGSLTELSGQLTRWTHSSAGEREDDATLLGVGCSQLSVLFFGRAWCTKTSQLRSITSRGLQMHGWTSMCHGGWLQASRVLLIAKSPGEIASICTRF